MAHNLIAQRRVIYDQNAGDFMRLRNNSGAARSPGEVVIWDTSVDYPAYTTTTTQDDALVCGVVASYTAAAAEGLVQFRGYLQSENLFVNGTTDITDGDFLSTFTSAGIAAKATSGKAGSFAVALEAYATNDSAGRIKVLLIQPSAQDASATVTYGTAGQMAADGLQASNAAGSTAAVARIDHAHAYTNDTPALTFGTSNATGTVGSVLASDASLAIFDTTAPTVIGFADSAAVGTAAFAARRDHTHGSPAASTAPVDGSSHAASDAVGTSSAVARADHAHQGIVLDDVVHAFGSDSDVGMVHLTGGVGANTVSSGVLEGTPVTQATPNGSLIIGSVTDGGDFLVAVSPAGNSLEAIRVDASASQVQLGHGVLDTAIANGSGLIVGSFTQRSINGQAEVQIQGTSEEVDSALSIGHWSTTDAEEAKIKLLKSGNATIGSFTIVANNEELGGITWYGDDGVDYNSIAAEINAEVDGTPGAGDMPGRLVFSTTADGAETPTEVMRLTSAQNVAIGDANGLIVGGLTQVSVGDGAGGAQTTEVQIQGTAAADSSLNIGRWQASANGPSLGFTKSRSGTIGTATVVQENDELGFIYWSGANGADHSDAAADIRVYVDGTPGANDMPGRMVFGTTADGGQATTEVMRLTSTQNVAVGNGNGLIVGALTQQALSDGAGATLTPELQVQGTAQADSHGGLLRSSADAGGPGMVFTKSRNAAIGSFTIVADADVLGQLIFSGDDGVDYMSTAAIIRAEVDGTPGVGDMPGLLRFMVSADGAESPTSRMVIGAPGYVIIGTTDTTTFTASAGSLVFDEISATTGTATNQAQIYAYDSATVTVMAQQKSDGTNADL